MKARLRKKIRKKHSKLWYKTPYRIPQIVKAYGLTWTVSVVKNEDSPT